MEELENVVILEERDYHKFESGPFILVMEPRFSGLLAACEVVEEGNAHTGTYEMVWTFDPNVVFTALEYLMARLGVQMPQERMHLEALLNNCTPRRSSLRLALTFTTKLAMLMQRQNELEMATNRISSAISSTLELEPMLQSAVDEVGHALKARRAALVLWHEGTSRPESMSIYERPGDTSRCDTDLSHSQTESLRTEDLTADLYIKSGPLEVPITYRNSVIGVLGVEDDRLGRDWEDEEVLMVKTVADQLAVAISHARLFRQMQTQAMTDALTGLYNHGHFKERLDRETKLADRNNAEVSLILLDLDHLKRINDTHGHRAGDAALCHVARVMQSSVREVDICARYGGEEFVVVLPQCGKDDAIKVARRLCEAIASTPVDRVGHITASIGVATYPTAANTKEELIEMADRAMYLAKASGRNRVRTLMHPTISRLNI
jgi:diguanylate cyclase (GGDEF)-like protein